jgi:ABC-2 type transport system permease protein
MGFIKRANYIVSCRNILWNMTLRELKSKYVGSTLGIWWAVVTPLLVMGVVTFVFTKVINIAIDNFPLFALSAIIPWFFFSNSLSEAATSLFKHASLSKQFHFPLEFLPLASILANFINYLFGLLFLIPVFCFFETAVVRALIFLPLVLLLHLFFTMGLGLIISCANVFFRDISHVLGIVLLFWFWVTPIFYSLDMVPLSFRWVSRLNPMTIYIENYRDILHAAENPLAINIVIAGLVGATTFFIGYVVFVRNETKIIKSI